MSDTLLHDFYNLDDLLHVLACGDESLEHQHFVIVEHVSIQTSHHLKADFSYEFHLNSDMTITF